MPLRLAHRHRLLLITAGLIAAVVISGLRAHLAGSLGVDQPQLAWSLRFLLGAGFGLGSAAFAWGALHEAAHGTTRLQRLLGPALGFHLLAACALPLTSNDVFSNLAYGHLLCRGQNPYLFGPSALGGAHPLAALVGPLWRASPIVYGPLAALLNLPACVSEGVVGALVGYKLALLGLGLAAALLAYGYCRRHLPAGEAAQTFVLVAWSPLLLWEGTAQAHNDLLMTVAMLGVVWAATAERHALAVLCLGAAFYTKYAVAPVAGLYLLYLARRSPWRAVLLGLGFLALGVLLMAPFWQGPATLLGPLGSAEAGRLRASRSLTDTLVVLAIPLGKPVQHVILQVCWSAGLVFLAVLGVRCARRIRTLDDVWQESLRFLVLYELIVTPWCMPWYGLWLLPLLLGVRDAWWRWFVALYAALLTVQYLFPVSTVAATIVDVWLIWIYLRPERLWRVLHRLGIRPQEVLNPPAGDHCSGR